MLKISDILMCYEMTKGTDWRYAFMLLCLMMLILCFPVLHTDRKLFSPGRLMQKLGIPGKAGQALYWPTGFLLGTQRRCMPWRLPSGIHRMPKRTEMRCRQCS